MKFNMHYVPTFQDYLSLMLSTFNSGNQRYAELTAYHLSLTLKQQDITIKVDRIVRISGRLMLIKYMKHIGMV